MFKILRITIDKKFYPLVSFDGQVWRLYWICHQEELKDSGTHFLDYWQKKGVIVNEVKKDTQG